MALPASGNSLSLNQLHIEAGGTSGTTCSLNDADIRDIINVSAGGSQNIQQYFGQSAQLLGDTETVSGTNTGGVASQTFSFPGGVSNHDVILLAHFNYGDTTGHMPYLGSVYGAHYQSVLYYATRLIWSAGVGISNSLAPQVIVCGPNTPNSFTWYSNIQNATYDQTGNAAFFAVKYATDGCTSVNHRGSTTVGRASNGNTLGTPAPGTGNFSTTLAPNHAGASTPSVDPSVADGIIGWAIKGGNNPNNWSFDTAGDVNATQAMANSNDLKVYTKSQDAPGSGSYSSIGVQTGYGGTSWMYSHNSIELRR